MRLLPALGACALLAAALALAAFGSDVWLGIGLSLAMWIALTQSWSLLSGMSGYISLGHVVFYGIGAYVAVLSWQELPLALAIPLAALAAGLFAAVLGLPVMRVRGPYFVILSFGVAELVKHGVVAIESALGKSSRMLFGTPELRHLYLIMLLLAVSATALAVCLRNSRLGDGLRAIRENELAAESIGVPVTAYKLAALVLSALIPGAVGAIMALRSSYFEPGQVFDPMLSFHMIAMAVIGGADDARGPLFGAAFLVLLYELLWSRFPELYMVALGLLLIGFVLLLPRGICGALPRRGEAR